MPDGGRGWASRGRRGLEGWSVSMIRLRMKFEHTSDWWWCNKWRAEREWAMAWAMNKKDKEKKKRKEREREFSVVHDEREGRYIVRCWEWLLGRIVGRIDVSLDKTLTDETAKIKKKKKQKMIRKRDSEKIFFDFFYDGVNAQQEKSQTCHFWRSAHYHHSETASSCSIFYHLCSVSRPVTPR